MVDKDLPAHCGILIAHRDNNKKIKEKLASIYSSLENQVPWTRSESFGSA